MDQREEYNRQLHALIASKGRNNVYMSKATYAQMLTDVKKAKLKQHSKTPLDYRRLQRYDILTVDNESKLISPVADWNDPKIQYFVTIDETYDVIHEAHLNSGHAGRNLLLKELNLKYKNVTTEAVMVYLNLCRACRDKSRRKRNVIDTPEQESVKKFKGTVVRSLEMNDLNFHCQVNFIDMLTHPDNGYKFILIYLDQRTKFIILRPLKTKTPPDIAENLLDIFTLIGTPSVLQFDNMEFANRIITELMDQWNEIKLVLSKPSQLQVESMETISEDVQNRLCTWLGTNKTTKWSQGLKFVQMMKNCAYHDEIKESPYESLFGFKSTLSLNLAESAKTGVHSPKTDDVQLEEDLPDLITNAVDKSSLDENVYNSSFTEEATSTTENNGDGLTFTSEIKVENHSIDYEELKINIEGQNVKYSDIQVPIGITVSNSQFTSDTF